MASFLKEAFFFQGTPIFSKPGQDHKQDRDKTKPEQPEQGESEGIRLGTHQTAGRVTCGGAFATKPRSGVEFFQSQQDAMASLGAAAP